MSKRIVAGGCTLLLVAAVGCGTSKESGSETEVQAEPSRNFRSSKHSCLRGRP